MLFAVWRSSVKSMKPTSAFGETMLKVKIWVEGSDLIS